MSTKTPDNSATAHISVANEQIARAAVNVASFMNENPNSGLQRQLQGADTLATLETLAGWLADNAVVSAFLCRMVEQERTASTLTDIAQELQAQVKHSETIIARLRSEIETQEQTIQRQAQAADLWHVAADAMNDLLADTVEVDSPEPLLDRFVSMVIRIKVENRRLHACPAPQPM